MARRYRVEYYATWLDALPSFATHADTYAEARKYAARYLGRESLRGAKRWDRYQGGEVWEFRSINEPPASDLLKPFVVIIRTREEQV